MIRIEAFEYGASIVFHSMIGFRFFFGSGYLLPSRVSHTVYVALALQEFGHLLCMDQHTQGFYLLLRPHVEALVAIAKRLPSRERETEWRRSMTCSVPASLNTGNVH